MRAGRMRSGFMGYWAGVSCATGPAFRLAPGPDSDSRPQLDNFVSRHGTKLLVPCCLADLDANGWVQPNGGIDMGEGRPSAKIALIVEDDADQRELIAALLRKNCGLEILECESAEAALATMLLRGREVSLVFSDLRLSGVMDGVDLARELRMRWPHLIVVITSGNPGTRLVHLPPGVKFVAKPWTATDVCLAAAQSSPVGPLCAPTSWSPQ